MAPTSPSKPTSANSSGSNGGGVYKRASRKNAPRKFACEFEGCDKIYSRAEHLQRHQLNHNPHEIFTCDLDGCHQKFVRVDLLNRHKKRHSSNYTPRNRAPAFTDNTSTDEYHESSPIHESNARTRSAHQRVVTHNGPRDAAILLTPDSSVDPMMSHASALDQQHHLQLPPIHQQHHHHHASPSPHQPQRQQTYHSGEFSDMHTNWRSPPAERPPSSSLMLPKTYYSVEPPLMSATTPSMVPFQHESYQPGDHFSQDNYFTAWLLDPQATNNFNVANLPFLEGGLESTFNNKLHYDYESLTSRSHLDVSPPSFSDQSDNLLSEQRRQELLRCFQDFRQKQSNYDELMPNLLMESGGDLPGLGLDMIRDCIREFWDVLSPRLPIVHQHTFSSNQCNISLLLVIIALGAASLRGRDRTGRLAEYGPFGDVIIHSVRWEILTSEDATPPICLWVAQALLLLEFYEKLYSTRKHHERAHIYHSSFLTLLRRGSPLIGRGDNESLPELDAGGHANAESARGSASSAPVDSRTWWRKWAETESMHRVVFAAFMLDILHAAMFGHSADMAAHEVRLPLPCDDSLWTANSPDVVRQLDANLRMYGVKQVTFLDGLKSALHGKEVKTHSFGRMILVAGLFSIGWHLGHRENHLKWLDLRPSSASEAHDNWRKLLLRAFDNWRGSFENATKDSTSSGTSLESAPTGPISSASMLYHLANFSLHTDIVDCQVYAGAKRLLGRRVSSRDYQNAFKRMQVWSRTASTRHAILHAFKLLYQALFNPNPQRRGSLSRTPETATIRYSIRDERDPHRSWIMYYATLTIWAFVQALGPSLPSNYYMQPERSTDTLHLRVADYLAEIAGLTQISEQRAEQLQMGLPELLDVMDMVLAEAETDLLAEAKERLRACKQMLFRPRG